MFVFHYSILLLSNLNPDEENDFSENVRKFACYGIVYTGGNLFLAYCPFCAAQNPNDSNAYFTNDRSHYGHSKKCIACQNFVNYISKIEENFLNSLAEFCSEKNIKLSVICSKSFTKIIQKINPFLKRVPRQKLRDHILTLFEYLKCKLNREKCGEFCSLLIDGSKRHKFNFYGFIVHSKKRLFYFQIKNLQSTDSETISFETTNIINYIQGELGIEIISICTDHASNMKKAFNASESISSQILTDSFFEWVGCFSHLLNLCISDLFKDNEFKIYFDVLIKYLNICKEKKIPNIPTFCKTRWESLSKCFNAIFTFKLQIIEDLNLRINELTSQINNPNQTNIDSIISEHSELMIIIQNGFLNPKFFETANIISYLANLIFKFGSDDFLIYMVYPEIIKLEDFLNSLSCKNFKKIICDRIFN